MTASMSEKGTAETTAHLERTTSYTVPNSLKHIPTADTLHNDEATKVLGRIATADAVDWDELEERKLVKKLDKRVMPLLFLTFGLQYYDKALLSSAVSAHPHFFAHTLMYVLIPCIRLFSEFDRS